MATVARDIGKGVEVTCYLYEGNVTRRRTHTATGYTDDTYTFSAGLKKNDIVQIWTASTDAGYIIAAADDRDAATEALATTVSFPADIGIIVTEPYNMPDYGIETGSTKTVSSHSYMRQATVMFPGHNCIREFTISGSSKAGQAVGWDTSEGEFGAIVGSSYGRQGILMETGSGAFTGSVLF